MNLTFLHFCSVQALSRLGDGYPNWEGPLALLSPPIEVLISPRLIRTDTPRNNSYSDTGTSSGLSKWTKLTVMHCLLACPSLLLLGFLSQIKFF